MKVRIHINLLIIILTLFSGCTPIQFSTLQSNYVDLLKEKDSRTKPGADQGFTSNDLKNLETLNTAFLALAFESSEAAKEANNKATRVGLLRLGMMAGWQSETPEGFKFVNELSASGSSECQKFTKDEFKPARDCSIVTVMPLSIAADISLKK